MTLQALGIAAAGGNALLRRIDAVSAALAKAANAPLRSGDLDLVIEGDGFLCLTTADGDARYLRGGSLTRNADGFLATADGLVLDPPIQVPSFIKTLTIDPDGFVQGTVADAPEAPLPLGQIDLSRFENPSALESADGVLFRATDAAGDRIDAPPGEGMGLIRPQPAIDPMRELMNLLALQRAFELNAKVIQVADEVLQGINTLRRKP
jgi:flagellar basal-body rod protein FlgG